MNIEISDEMLAKAIEEEMLRVTNASYGNKSHIQKAVKKVMQDMAKERILQLMKSNSVYVSALNKMIEENIIAAFHLVAVRIAKDLGESIVSAVESEFRSYSD